MEKHVGSGWINKLKLRYFFEECHKHFEEEQHYTDKIKPETEIVYPNKNSVPKQNILQRSGLWIKILSKI